MTIHFIIGLILGNLTGVSIMCLASMAKEDNR